MQEKQNTASKAGHKHSLATECPTGDLWGRLPKPQDRRLGLTRTTIFEMCVRGEVKSCVIKKRGAKRGIRVIFLPSLTEALDRLAAEQATPATAQEGGPSDA